VGWKDVGRVAPFFAMAAALGLVTVWFQSHQSIGSDVVRTDGFWSRLAVAGRALWFYLGKALLPLDLSFVYSRWEIPAGNPLTYMPLVLWVAGLAICWHFRKRWGKGALFALGYFSIMLLPVLGFLNIYFMRYSLVADHWQYFAIIGPIALAAAIIRKPVVGAALLLALGALTWKQCGIYANSETLWQTTLRQNPDCWMGRDNLGLVLVQQGRMDEAMTQFQKSLEVKPDCEEACYDLGIALEHEGRVDEAIAHYQQALEIQPAYIAARNNLGLALLQKARVEEAISQFQKALQISPEYAEAHNNLGLALLQKGRADEAISQFQKAQQINPDYAEARLNLGNVLLQTGRADEAIAQYQQALQIRPDYAEAHYNLGNALAQKGNTAEAIRHYRQAAQINPADPKAQNNLAWLLATSAEPSLRNGSEAVALAQKANELSGGENPVVLHTLAAAFAETGQFAEARRAAQKAVELARAAGQRGLAEQISGELKSYEAGRPWHDAKK